MELLDTVKLFDIHKQYIHKDNFEKAAEVNNVDEKTEVNKKRKYEQ